MQSYAKNVSMTVVRRLPKYYQYLKDLEDRGVEKISSKELASLMGLTASQIRQDLNSFGAYGQQGYGYRVLELKEAIKQILGLSATYDCILIGGGNIGQALAKYNHYRKDGILINAIFDVDPEEVARKTDIAAYGMDGLEDYVANNSVDICILAIPREAARNVADRVVKAGVRAILNFAPIDLDLPENVIVNNVSITDNFYTLTYLLAEDAMLKEQQKQKNT